MRVNWLQCNNVVHFAEQWDYDIIWWDRILMEQSTDMIKAL